MTFLFAAEVGYKHTILSTWNEKSNLQQQGYTGKVQWHLLLQIRRPGSM